MKIIDKYIIKKILSTFFFVVVMLSAVIVAIDITEKVDKFSKNNLDTLTIMGYYQDFVPWIAGLLTPITVFISVVFVTSQMAGRTEIIAILSSGVSFRRFLFPYFLASAVIGVLSFFLNGWVIPQSNLSRLAFQAKYFDNVYYFDKRNVHMQIEPNVYLYLQNYNNQSNTGYQFTLERFNDNKLIEKLTADNIAWDSAKHKWILKYWKIKKIDSIFRVTSKAEKIHLAREGETMDTTLALSPKDFENDNRQYDGMTIPELDQHIAKLKFRGSTGVEQYEVEKQIRYSAPFTIFVLVFMGVIVSSRKSRGGTGFQIALGFMLSFVFILFFMMSRTFAETGSLSPVLAAWIPNIVFTAIAAFMYKYVPR